MFSLSKIFVPGRRRQIAATVRLNAAYERLFLCPGAASQEDADLVLADLAAFSGFYAVTNDPDQLQFNEGKRAVFQRIMRAMTMTVEEKRALEEAARIETITTEYEGDI